jgi:hypothetical protein
LLDGLAVGSARKGVAWMRGNLVSDLRGMRMGRVTAGRTRVTIECDENIRV